MKYNFKKKQSLIKIYQNEIKFIIMLSVIPIGILLYNYPIVCKVVFSALAKFLTILCLGLVFLIILGILSETACKRKLVYLPLSLEEMKENHIENLYDYIVFLSDFLNPKFNFNCGPIKIPDMIQSEIVNSFKLYTDFEGKKVRLDIKLYNTMNTSFVNITENYQFCIYYGEGQSGLETHKDLLESLNMEDLLTLGGIIPKEKFEFYRDLPL